MSEKYILRTETDTLYLDKLIQKEEFIYVEGTGILLIWSEYHVQR